MFVDYDFKPGLDRMLGYNAQGKPNFLADEVRGLVVVAAGEWNPAYGEGFRGLTVMKPGNGYYAVFGPSPVSVPPLDYDPYPNAHAEVGPIEPAW